MYSRKYHPKGIDTSSSSESEVLQTHEANQNPSTNSVKSAFWNASLLKALRFIFKKKSAFEIFWTSSPGESQKQLPTDAPKPNVTDAHRGPRT